MMPPVLLAPEVRQLVDQLTQLGIELPPTVQTGANHLQTLTSSPADQLLANPPAGLLQLDTAELITMWERQSFVWGLREQLGATAQGLANTVAGELLAALRVELDQVLDQLRPAFDQAAAGVRRAVALGIGPDSTADAVLDLDSADATAAWRRLPDQLNHLDTIGRLRVRLADLLDHPSGDPFAHDRRPYAAMFTASNAGAPWDTDADRRSLPGSRWLRLSSTGPVTLLSVAATEAAAARVRTVPAYAAAVAAGLAPAGRGPVLADFDVDAEAAAWRSAGDPAT